MATSKTINTDKFKEVLVEKQAAISKQIIGLRKKIKKSLDEGRVYERNSGDPDSDFVTESSEIERDEMMILQLEKNLHDIDDALKAIEGNYYGECQMCGKHIDPARLKVIPWAKYCYSCQNSLEKNQ
ncbi:MAG: TraR/DksA C4-type zinc finger protein [bacterium]|jgi:DnaK suppressor protein